MGIKNKSGFRWHQVWVCHSDCELLSTAGKPFPSTFLFLVLSILGSLWDWIQLDYVDFSFNPDLSFNLVQFLMYVEVCSGEYLLFVFPVLGLISVYGKSARSVSVCRLTPGELGKQINAFYSQTYIPAEETSSHTHGYQFHGSALYFTFWANYFNPRQFDKGRLDL